jgi:hypothetical protein
MANRRCNVEGCFCSRSARQLDRRGVSGYDLNHACACHNQKGGGASPRVQRTMPTAGKQQWRGLILEGPHVVGVNLAYRHHRESPDSLARLKHTFRRPTAVKTQFSRCETNLESGEATVQPPQQFGAPHRPPVQFTGIGPSPAAEPLGPRGGVRAPGNWDGKSASSSRALSRSRN